MMCPVGAEALTLACRSIIPRSLSSTFQSGSHLISSQSSESLVDLSFRPSLRTDLMCHQSEKQKEGDKKIAFQSQVVNKQNIQI